jgi:hypothetical protein
MSEDYYDNFFDEDTNFLSEQYPHLSKEDKMYFWESLLGHDFIYGGRYHYRPIDPLDKFNESNYAKWKQIEPDFDSFLAKIIVDFGLHLLKSEIYRRIGKVE